MSARKKRPPIKNLRMYDYFATSDMRDTEKRVTEGFATDPNALLSECRTILHRAEVFSPTFDVSEKEGASARLTDIQKTVEEIADGFRALSVSLPMSSSLFRVSPDEKALLKLSHTLLKLEMGKASLDAQVCAFSREMESYKTYEAKLLSALTVLTVAADVAHGSTYYDNFHSLCQATKQYLALCKQCIARISQVTTAVMRFSSRDLLCFRKELLSAADFAGHGKAGDLDLLRRRAGDFAFAVGRFSDQISMLRTHKEES